MGKKYKGFKGSGMRSNKLNKKEVNELTQKMTQELIMAPLLRSKFGLKSNNEPTLSELYLMNKGEY